MNISQDFKIEVAEIICVGTEILLGQIVNTNAQFLAKELSELGINSFYQEVVGDNKNRLLETIKLAMSRSDLVILTGGLGPTKDDISMEVAALASNNKLVENEQEKTKLLQYFSINRKIFTENNFKQILLPEDGIILPNEKGTAAGAIMSNKNPNAKPSLIALLPGPPQENTHMFKNYLKPFLLEHSDYTIDNTYIRTFGIGESLLAEILDEYLSNFENPSIASYVFDSELVLRISYKHKRSSGKEKLDELSNKISKKLENYIFEIGDRPLKKVLFDLLKEKKKSVAFAESCTAGNVSAQLASLPGASAVLKGGAVVYDAESKIKVLNIKQELIKTYGTISKEVAENLAENIRILFNSDYGVGITGNAGPNAIEGKDKGLVYIAVSDSKCTVVEELMLSGDRLKVIEYATQSAYNLLRKRLLEK